MTKRKVAQIEMYDYVSMEDYQEHKSEMYENGYREVGEMFGGVMKSGVLEGSEKYSYSASYIKSEGV